MHVYRPDVVELAELRKLATGPDRAARFRAAASLAKAVDLRDTYTGSHSARVADLAARVAARLGLDQEQIELARLAGSLHDLGKLAIPEEILRKPGPLTGPERLSWSATRRSGSGCSTAWASSRSPTGSSITTSAGTDAATPTGSPARRSRSARGSSSSSTRTTP